MRYGAKQPQDENANTEYKHLRPEVTRGYRTNYRSKRCSDESLPGNSQRSTQR